MEGSILTQAGKKKRRERLLEPYHWLGTDRERLSGLGLALCKTLLELHGGRMWVESRKGKAATFGFT